MCYPNCKIDGRGADGRGPPRFRVSVDEEQLPVLGQGPHLVVDHELQGVHVGADVLQHGDHLVVVLDGRCASLSVGLDLLDQHIEPVDLGLGGGDVLGDALDQVELRCGILLELLLAVDLLEVLDVLLCLVV